MTKTPATLRRCRQILLGAILALPAVLPGQINLTETFKGTSAPGWSFGASSGSTTPYLTAGTSVGDTSGNGWLRLTESAGNQATYALWDNAVFSVNAQIQIEMEYAFYNKGASTMGGGDGMAFFLVDAAQTGFQAGGYGGSLGYAPLDANDSNSWNSGDKTGMPGGYLGFGFDNWGNYGDSTEGRDGNFASPVQGHQNTISVRGPDDGDGNNSTGWGLIASSAPLDTLAGGGQMDFPDSGTRPDQSGSGYRSFRLTLDANNQLLVEMKFSATGNYITAFTADLSTFERPEYFKIGFTASTGGAYEIHEVRNVTVNMTPWQPDSFEWSDAASGSGDSWASGGNWVGGNVPSTNADILFGDAPTSGPQPVQLDSNRQLNSLTFDSAYDYSVNGTATITLGNASVAGLPSINVNDYNDANARHKINVPLSLAENLKINNYSFSTLCINGDIATNGKSITTTGYGATNLNGAITGSGDLVVNGSSIQGTGAGIVTISGANTAWSGDVTVNNGQLVVLGDNALGLTGTAFNKNINQNAANGATTIRIANSGTIPVVGQEVTGNSNIPAGTVITAVTASGGNYILTLSNALTGAISNNTSLNYAYGNTTVNDGGTLTFRGGITSAEKLTIKGAGTVLGRGELAGALYNDGGDNTLSGTIALGANSSVRSRDGNLTLSGVISGAYSLTKTGDGVVTLSGAANTYTGATIVEGGALRVIDAAALPGGFATGGTSGGNLTLNGGVLEIGTGTNFTRRLGSAADRVQFTGDGGFAAYGAARSVSLATTGDTTYGTVTWNSTAGFLTTGDALILGSETATHAVTLTNAIDLAASGVTTNSQREIRVIDGANNATGAVDGILSGNITDTGTGGIVKTGSGTLELTGTGNNYAGATEIKGGALRGNLSANSNLQLNGGVREIAANTALTLGTSGGNVRWTGDGGFAAVGGAYNVNLSSGAALTWGTTTNFVGANNALLFGATSANNTATLTNNLSLGGTASDTRTIKTIQGTGASVASGALSGVVSGSANLNVAGNGRLDLTAANTMTGALTVIGSEVRLNGANGALGVFMGNVGGTESGVSSITVKQGGQLTLDNAANNNTARIRDTASVTLNGGTLNFLGAAAASSETIGVVTLSGGANTINVQRNGANSSTLTLGGLSVTDDSATINFTNAAGGGALGSGTGNPGILIAGVPNNTAVAYGFATVNGSAFATYGANGVVALASTATDQSAWNASVHAAPSNNTQGTLSANATVGSLLLTGGRTVSGAYDLTVASGGILSFGSSANAISVSTLHAGSGADNLYTHVYGTGGLTVSSSITNDGSTAKGLVKSGDGTLTLSGSTANTYTGKTTVNEGALVLAKSANTTAIAGDLVVGDGRGQDVVRIDANEQIADTATVTLRGGEVGNSANVASLVFADANGSITESFHTLKIEGNTVLDFAGGNPCAPSFLYLDVLDIADDGLLTIKNWIEFTDFLLVDKTTATTEDLARIVFDGYGGAAAWKDYDSDYYQLVPYAPVPEPAAFGLLSLGGLVTFAATRRRRRLHV